jgi:hypothetical protein
MQRIPRLASGRIAGMEAFVFVPFDSFLYAVDILGYTFMSAATLFAAFALTGDGVERTARRFMIANGLLIPFLVFQMYWHSLIWVASLWAITFPGAMVALALISIATGVQRPRNDTLTVVPAPGPDSPDCPCTIRTTWYTGIARLSSCSDTPMQLRGITGDHGLRSGARVRSCGRRTHTFTGRGTGFLAFALSVGLTVFQAIDAHGQLVDLAA